MAFHRRAWTVLAVSALALCDVQASHKDHDRQCAVPCCGPERMDEPMTLSEHGAMSPSSGDQCHVGTFGKERLHEALGGRWLYFTGDSSTRGLFLALYYELLGAKQKLVDAKLVGRGLTTADAVLRTETLFGYGSPESREECKDTLRSLGRGTKWVLEECDDFGDPCGNKHSFDASTAAAGVDDSVLVLPHPDLTRSGLQWMAEKKLACEVRALKPPLLGGGGGEGGSLATVVCDEKFYDPLTGARWEGKVDKTKLREAGYRQVGRVAIFLRSWLPVAALGCSRRPSLAALGPSCPLW